MGLKERALIGALEFAGETSLGKAASQSAGKLAEEAMEYMALQGLVKKNSLMPVPMYRVLRKDGRGLYSDFNWAEGGHLPRLTENGWLAGKPVSHRQISFAGDPKINDLIERRAGMGEGIYLTANPFKWVERPGDRVFQAFLKDREDRSRLGHYFQLRGEGRSPFQDYLLCDFNAGGRVILTRELNQNDLAMLKRLSS